MKIFFNTIKIEKLCNNNTEAVKKWGKDSAKKLQQRLSQLSAANKLSDFNFDNPHPLKGGRIGKFSVALQGGLRIVFEAREPIPTTSDEVTDWNNVKEITITIIEDYHQ